MKVETLIERVFAARNAAHIAHWKTKSYGHHVALGEFYEGVTEALDSFVEATQGTFGVVGDVKGEKTDIAKCIRDEIVWINEHREKICREVPALENLLDNLTAIHMSTLNKLENMR